MACKKILNSHGKIFYIYIYIYNDNLKKLCVQRTLLLVKRWKIIKNIKGPIRTPIQTRILAILQIPSAQVVYYLGKTSCPHCLCNQSAECSCLIFFLYKEILILFKVGVYISSGHESFSSNRLLGSWPFQMLCIYISLMDVFIQHRILHMILNQL